MNNILWISGGRVIDPANQRDAVSDVYAINGQLVEKLTDLQKKNSSSGQRDGLNCGTRPS